MGRIVICHVGVRDDGEFDILNVKTEVPLQEYEARDNGKESNFVPDSPNYIG